jgi:hypothetical protein
MRTAMLAVAVALAITLIAIGRTTAWIARRLP